MKIIIPGGSGQVGTILARHFHKQRHDVTVLSRKPQPRPWTTLPWNGVTIGDWAATFEGADAVINLAGRSVNCRYNSGNRADIMNSRVNSTRIVGQAIRAAKQPPKLWLQASTATIYAHRYDAANDEVTGILGGSEPDAPAAWRFSIDVAKAWERAATEHPLPAATRQVLMRSAIILSPDRGGIFDTLLRLVRFGLGGTVADGRQYMSWIHETDFARSVEWLIHHSQFSGPVNIAAPNPLPYRDFMRILRKAWGIPIGLPATKWMLEIGTFLMQTESELVLKSRRVVAGRLDASGFDYTFPQWDTAAQDLVARWKN